MNGIPNANVIRLIDRAMNSNKPDGRSRGRMRCNNVSTSFGPVLDFSATGVRILSKRELRHCEDNQPLTIELHSDFDPVMVKVMVRWTRKLGFRRYEAGLEFVEVDDEVKRVLGEIARSVPADSFCMIHSMNRKAG
ncbi:MAG: PilZ domain-containing protein [Phycisphaerales bacterium JB065]